MQVSVWITTYNHEHYIAKAIESVLMQKTNFDVEIVVGEDCSTDRTRSIVLDYNEKYPGKFSLLLPEKNLGMIPMFKASYPLCRGKYVAWLDGDDYWTDPLKLQKQVNFMETHPEYAMCFHNVSVLDEIDDSFYEREKPRYMNSDGSLSLSHFCYYNPVATCSVVYRNVLDEKLPEWFYQLSFPDLAFYFLLSEKGKIKYLDEKMGVYRIHKGGQWSGKDRYNNFLQLSQFYKKLDEIFDGKYRKYISKNATWYSYELLNASIEKGQYSTARNCFRHIFINDPNFIMKNKRRFFNLALILYLRSKPDSL